ncbi:MAG: hypothetical protein J7497_13350 [Chitinophagaceae bacterium]|nr:hypothetical protein [Chitinophagaceae bacterium]
MRNLIIAGIFALATQSAIGENDNNIPPSQVNEKAVNHFNKSYNEIPDERWTRGEDCYRVSFEKESVKYIIDYHLNGKWRNSIRIYDEQHLSSDIRETIKSGFIGSEITTVTELDFGKGLIYFIKIRQNEWNKTLQVVHGQVTVVEEFKEI